MFLVLKDAFTLYIPIIRFMSGSKDMAAPNQVSYLTLSNVIPVSMKKGKRLRKQLLRYSEFNIFFQSLPLGAEGGGGGGFLVRILL